MVCYNWNSGLFYYRFFVQGEKLIKSLFQTIIKGSQEIISESDLYSAYQQKLDLLLFFPFRNKVPHNISPALYERMENRFKISLARWLYLKDQAAKLEIFLRENNIKSLFIKGYVLAKDVYVHPAVREMSDVDLFLENDKRQPVRNFLKKEGYSLVKTEKGVAAKELWIKLSGQHEVCFEFHGNIFTDFSGRPLEIPSSFFEEFSNPSPEALFLSVLLHHPYYYCRLRDYVDLFFIMKKQNPDMDVVESFCRQAGLLKHFTRTMNYLNFLSGKNRDSEFYSPLLLIRSFSLKGRGNYSFFTKILDAVFYFFVYDSIFTGIKSFCFRYGRFFHKR